MEPDFYILDEGTLVLFTPLTEAAKDFSVEAFGGAETFGHAFVVGHRFARDIIDDLINEQGFAIQIGRPTWRN
jgi:hypothetical protein